MRFACTLLLAGLCAADASATVFHAPAYIVFDLTPAEARTFESLACMDRYGVPIDRAQGSISDSGKLADALAVYAQCRSHRKVDGQPVYFDVECKRERPGAEWHCDAGVENMVPRMDGVTIRIYNGDGVTIDKAYAAIKNLFAAGKFKPGAVADREPPNTEGVASCKVFTPPDNPTKVYCDGTDMFTLDAALEMKP